MSAAASFTVYPALITAIKISGKSVEKRGNLEQNELLVCVGIGMEWTLISHLVPKLFLAEVVHACA